MFLHVGGTESKAIENLRVAVRLFLEEAGRIGTLEQILQEAGYGKTKKKFAIPELVSMQRMSLPLTHAKA